MKKLLLFAALFSITTLQAQTFTDNFDSYIADSTMASQSTGFWTTWSGTPGSQEDVLVTNADAASVPNSCYFSSNTVAGGPTDLVRKFGVLSTGLFSINFNIKVEEGKTGYFNFQRDDAVGLAWSMDCYFRDNDSLVITNTTGVIITQLFGNVYPQAEWFNFRMDIDFDINQWKVFVNNDSLGSFSNLTNQIASIDIYPSDLVSPFACGFYLDDFEYRIGEEVVDTVSSIKELNLENAIVTLYPNPSEDNTIMALNMQKRAAVSATITNITGELISSEKYGYLFGENKINLSTAKLEAGIYFVQILMGDEKITKRLVVK